MPDKNSKNDFGRSMEHHDQLMGRLKRQVESKKGSRRRFDESCTLGTIRIRIDDFVRAYLKAKTERGKESVRQRARRYLEARLNESEVEKNMGYFESRIVLSERSTNNSIQSSNPSRDYYFGGR